MGVTSVKKRRRFVEARIIIKDESIRKALIKLTVKASVSVRQKRSTALIATRSKATTFSAMNPSGLRLEEKKSADEVRSVTSYKSTHSTRSSVLERAREYNRRIDEQNQARRRAKSLERPGSESGSAAAATPRSKSTGRVPQSAPRLSTHERAMQSVRRDSSRYNNNRPQQQQQQAAPSSRRTASPHVRAQPQHDNVRRSTGRDGNNNSRSRSATPREVASSKSRDSSTRSSKDSPNNRSVKSGSRFSGAQQQQQQQQPENQEAIVSPELLVDALSGHEDGLLAIAEKLMEHYDAGYDVMGEAIIDAFADVQKLFQHVVEAAHMEGAAFEASRRESEISELRRKAADVNIEDSPSTPVVSTPNGPTRHDEFIDQDVKDILTDAIRNGTALRDTNRHSECYELFEQACQAASALLPVDSDHRGRLQLSIARAESMSPDRACAILRYAMDDVLRSGLRAGRTPLPDPSKRADVVLVRPRQGQAVVSAVGVGQSSDEALASLMEEMKEILSAPVYSDTPLQNVTQRFWVALNESQKTQQKNAERLEQNLAKLKGEFLLARAVR